MQGGKCLHAVLEASNQPQCLEAIHSLDGECDFGAGFARVLAPVAAVSVRRRP